jgi:hypothetical protein
MAKKYLDCFGLSLLNDFGIDSIYVKFSNVSRVITPKGVFLQKDFNEKIQRHMDLYNGFNMVKVKDEPIFINGKTSVDVSYSVLYLEADRGKGIFKLKASDEVFVNLNLGEVNFSGIRSSFSSRYSIDLISEVLQNKKEIKVPQILKNIEGVDSLLSKDMLDNYVTDNQGKFANAYRLIDSQVLENLTPKDFSDYKKVFNYILSSYSLTERICESTIFKNVDELLETVGFPYELRNWAKIGLKVLSYKTEKFDRIKWSKIDDNIRNTLIETVEHGILSDRGLLTSIDIILELMTEVPQSIEFLPKFIMKYGIVFGDKIIVEFKAAAYFIRDNHLSFKDILSTRKIGAYNTTLYLKNLKFSDERIDIFANFIDDNFDVILDLFESKGRLTKKEIEKYK